MKCQTLRVERGYVAGLDLQRVKFSTRTRPEKIFNTRNPTRTRKKIFFKPKPDPNPKKKFFSTRNPTRNQKIFTRNFSA